MKYHRQLTGSVGDVAYELSVRYLTVQRPKGWVPAINAYCCHNHMVICVELAGVDRSSIEIVAEARRLQIRGTRRPPEPEECDGPLMRVLALEIDHGPFERELALGVEIDPDGVRAEQRNGLLWVYLPVRGDTI